MILASDILELLKQRYPDKVPLVELSQFRLGELSAIQKIIKEIETEVGNGSNNKTG